MTRIPLPMDDEESKVESRKSKVESREPDEKSKVEKKKTSASQLKASAKWNQKQAQIAIRVQPTIKEQIDKHISITGESLAGFIVRAVFEQINRDNKVDLDKLLDE